MTEEAAQKHVGRLLAAPYQAGTIPSWLPVDPGARNNLRAASRDRGYGPRTVADRDVQWFCKFVAAMYVAPFCCRSDVAEKLAEYVGAERPEFVYGRLLARIRSAGPPEVVRLAEQVVGPCSYYRGWHAVAAALSVAAHARMSRPEPTPDTLLRLFSLFRQPPAPMRRRLGENARALARAFYEDAAPVLPILADAMEEDGFRSTWRHVRFYRERPERAFPGMWPLAPHWFEADASASASVEGTWPSTK